MAPKPNVRMGLPGSWERYAGVTLAEALQRIYDDAIAHSTRTRDWYWAGIRRKRLTSISVRAVSVAFVTAAAILQLAATLWADPANRLVFTQAGLAALAVAGLAQAADRVFGWSSGWLRYIMTVTHMEAVTRQFELDWAAYLIGRAGGIAESDRLALFQLAASFEAEIAKLQIEETEKWVADFDSGRAALDDLIKSQREATERMQAAAQELRAARQSGGGLRASALAGAAEPGGAADVEGAVEIVLNFKVQPAPLRIAVDALPEETFLGTVWAKSRLAPGQHEITICTSDPAAPRLRLIADVPAGGVARLMANIP
jgi:exonuclease VII small subunit